MSVTIFLSFDLVDMVLGNDHAASEWLGFGKGMKPLGNKPFPGFLGFHLGELSQVASRPDPDAALHTLPRDSHAIAARSARSVPFFSKSICDA